MDHIVVFIIIALAVVYLMRRLYQTLRNPLQTTCSCGGCQGCSDQHNCPGLHKSL